MHLATRVLIVVGCLLLIPVTAVLAAAATQRLSDGSDFVFSGGTPVTGGASTDTAGHPPQECAVLILPGASA